MEAEVVLTMESQEYLMEEVYKTRDIELARRRMDGFAVAFQSVNFDAREFLERSLRLDTLLQNLANKLNSNESFDPQQEFDVLLSVISMPTRGGKPTKYNVGRRFLEKILDKKRCIIPIKNKINSVASVPLSLCTPIAIEMTMTRLKLFGIH